MPGEGWPDLGLPSEPGEGDKSMLPVSAARAFVGVKGDVGLVGLEGERGGAITLVCVIMVGEICELETEAALRILRRGPIDRRWLLRVDLLKPNDPCW